MDKKWYVVHTYAGHENKVKAYIEEVAVAEGLAERISRIMIPSQDVVEIKKGKKVKKLKKFFPSYLIIEMELEKDIVHLVKNAPGVTNFVGLNNKPQPLRKEEVDRLLGQTEKGGSKKIQDIPFEKGEGVKIKDGPFKDFEGFIDEIIPEKGKMKVLVSVFGRATPVELNFLQVEALTIK